MNHEQFKEWLQLWVYDELNEEETAQLQKHMAECGECRAEFEKLKKFRSVLDMAVPAEPADELMTEARRELRAAIRIQRNKKNLLQRAAGELRELLFSNYKAALGSAFTLVLGLAIGYMLNKPASTRQETADLRSAISTDTNAKGDIKIDNLRFEDANPNNGEVAFSFDAVKPVRMKGKINDEAIQKVLARALVSEQNDGVRLRTLNAIAMHAEKDSTPDPRIKTALITAMKHDGNPGVRREALIVLQKLPMDQQIMDAFLYVLSNDKNSGMRIAAINSLQSEKPGELKANQELIRILQQKSRNDDNQYVRIRAKSVLQEVIEQ